MPYYTTHVVLNNSNGIPNDRASNTFHVSADDLTALGLFHDTLEDVYNNMGQFNSGAMAQNGHIITSYLDTDPEPRIPVLITPFNLAIAPSGGWLPLEVSLCLSFQGDPLSGYPQAWRRGRIYFPWIQEAENDSTGRPSSTLVNALVAQGDYILTTSASDGSWEWVTFSRVAPGYASVTNGWVDNEWDTQRRRGREATSRVTFP